MSFSWYGVGVLHYGRARKEPNGSYIVTQWITLFYLPILPLRSLRVQPMVVNGQQRHSWRGRWQYAAQPVPLHWPHLGWGYAATVLFVLWVLYCTA